jgi:hypothetical protein
MGNPGPALSSTAAPFGIDTVAGTPSKRGGAQIEAQVEQQQQRHQAVDASTPCRRRFRERASCHVAAV